MGPELMAKMEAQALHLGVDLVQDIVTDVRLDGPAVRRHRRQRGELLG